MKMKTKTRKNLLKLAGVCFAGAFAFSLSLAVNNISASAETPDKATGFYMEDGASVAKTADLDAAISWKTTISAEYYTYLTTTYEKIEFATLIAPYTTLSALEKGEAQNVIDQDWMQPVTEAGTYRVSLVYRPDTVNTQLTDEQKNNAYDMALSALSYVDCYETAGDTEPTRIYADYTDKDTTRSARGVAYQHFVEKAEKLDYIGTAQTNDTVKETQYFDVNYDYDTETSLNGYVNTGLTGFTGFTEESDVWENYSVYYGSEKIANPKFTVNTDGELLIAGFADEVSYIQQYTSASALSYNYDYKERHGDGANKKVTLIAKNGDYLEIKLKPCSRIFTQENISVDNKTYLHNTTNGFTVKSGSDGNSDEWERFFLHRFDGHTLKGYFVLGEDITYSLSNNIIDVGSMPDSSDTDTKVDSYGVWATRVNSNFTFDGLYHKMTACTGWWGLFPGNLGVGNNVESTIKNIHFEVNTDCTESGAFGLSFKAYANLTDVRFTFTARNYKSGSDFLPSIAKTRAGNWTDVLVEAKMADGTYCDYTTSKDGGIITSAKQTSQKGMTRVYVVGPTATTKLSISTSTYSTKPVIVENYLALSQTSAFANMPFAYDATNNTVGFKK